MQLCDGLLLPETNSETLRVEPESSEVRGKSLGFDGDAGTRSREGRKHYCQALHRRTHNI